MLALQLPMGNQGVGVVLQGKIVGTYKDVVVDDLYRKVAALEVILKGSMATLYEDLMLDGAVQYGLIEQGVIQVKLRPGLIIDKDFTERHPLLGKKRMFIYRYLQCRKLWLISVSGRYVHDWVWKEVSK